MCYQDRLYDFCSELVSETKLHASHFLNFPNWSLALRQASWQRILYS